MKQLKVASLFLSFILLCITTFAQKIPNKPVPERLVNDFAGILSEDYREKIEKMLVDFNDSTSIQICIVTLRNLKSSEASDIAYTIGQKWGVGQKDKDNGIVFLISPKSFISNGTAFIATGYGMEELLPDAICTRIINKSVIPYFKENDYNNGILEGATLIMQHSSGSYTAEKEEESIFIIFWVILGIFAIFISGGKGGSSSGGSSSGGGGSFRGFGGGSFGGGGGGGNW